jgi:hypothetical protein
MGQYWDQGRLGSSISNVTRISEWVLRGEDLELSSVAQRMSWASIRRTTRPENKGLVHIHLKIYPSVLRSVQKFGQHGTLLIRGFKALFLGPPHPYALDIR